MYTDSEEFEMVRLINDFGGEWDVTRVTDPPVYVAYIRLSDTASRVVAAYSLPELRAKMNGTWVRPGQDKREKATTA